MLIESQHSKICFCKKQTLKLRSRTMKTRIQVINRYNHKEQSIYRYLSTQNKWKFNCSKSNHNLTQPPMSKTCKFNPIKKDQNHEAKRAYHHKLLQTCYLRANQTPLPKSDNLYTLFPYSKTHKSHSGTLQPKPLQIFPQPFIQGYLLLST